MFSAFEKATSQFSKAWEESASRWWEGTLRDGKTLESMGGFLNGLTFAKERTDRALEDHWSRWRLASAGDVERLYERLGEIQTQLARIEAKLGTAPVNAPAAPAHEAAE